jgi:branched-subunit amino acid ABC-type transport system permease component
MTISELFDWGRDVFAQGKFYLINSLNYIGVVSFFLSLANFKKLYDIQMALWVLIPLAFFGAIFVGWVDYKYIFEMQIKHQNKKNDLKTKLDALEIKLDKLIEGKQ